MPIDTLKAAKRLQEDDTFSPNQAERIAEVLSEMDVASATKEDLDDLEERLTNRIDLLGDRIDETNSRLARFREEVDGRFDRLDGKVATQSDLKAVKSDVKAVKSDVKAVKSDLGQKIEEKHSATIRTVVGTVAAVGAVLAVVIPLAIHLMG